MKIYDISAPIFPGMPVYKNKLEKQPHIKTVLNGYVTESRLDIDVHTGTHIDAPLHMSPHEKGIESLPLTQFLGPCKVFDLQSIEDKISMKELEHLKLEKGDFVLFKTRNSKIDNFDFNFVYLSEDGANYLVEVGVRGVGIDALGIERDQPGHPTHKLLFANDIMIIEGLRLGHVISGDFIMVAAPLKLQGTEAVPARVFLIEADDHSSFFHEVTENK